MKHFVVAMLLLGAALLGVVIWQTDLDEVWLRLRGVGGSGLLALFAVFAIGHAFLAVSWLVTLPSVPRTPRWVFRAWRVLMVGSALESVTPLAGLGGEPVKAILLRRHYGIPYTDASASLVLSRMTDLIAQVLFIAIGFGFVLHLGLLPESTRAAAGGGLALFTLSIALFWSVQNHRGFSRLRAWLEARRAGRRPFGARAVALFDAVGEVEDQLVRFYAAQRARFAASVGFAFLEWTANAVAVWLALDLLGHPVAFMDAVVIEAAVALVRSTLFFVPADLGTQEAAQVFVCGAVMGSPETGLALAALRRLRDVAWILAGLAIGGIYSANDIPRAEPSAAAEMGSPER